MFSITLQKDHGLQFLGLKIGVSNFFSRGVMKGLLIPLLKVAHGTLSPAAPSFAETHPHGVF
uniref:Uncharacterized protein n=1 Tax=Anguilla anguilla TaxID=7936 RepID=A0A0E9VV62_ANGAN